MTQETVAKWISASNVLALVSNADCTGYKEVYREQIGVAGVHAVRIYERFYTCHGLVADGNRNLLSDRPPGSPEDSQ